MKRIFLILILIFTLNIIYAEESKYREDKGLQVQLLINGGALIGYHFNDQIFFKWIQNYTNRETHEFQSLYWLNHTRLIIVFEGIK